jgi:PhnB protein
MAVQPIPEGYHTITPYLIARDAARLIDFLQRAFHAEERHRSVGEDGTIRHAEVRIGNSIVMISEATEQYKPMPAMFYLYVEDTDATYKRAMEAGAVSLREPMDTFYGDRSAGVRDDFGNQWWIGTHQEDVSPEEMARREKEHNNQMAQQA